MNTREEILHQLIDTNRALARLIVLAEQVDISTKQDVYDEVKKPVTLILLLRQWRFIMVHLRADIFLSRLLHFST
jgi:hypothetical protein